jgi:hypothetical protein
MGMSFAGGGMRKTEHGMAAGNGNVRTRNERKSEHEFYGEGGMGMTEHGMRSMRRSDDAVTPPRTAVGRGRQYCSPAHAPLVAQACGVQSAPAAW